MATDGSRSICDALGMEPGDITHLIVSHLHFDHCGGIVRRRDSGAFEAAFPRARIFVQRGELEIADNPRNERLRAAYRHAEEILAPVRSMLEAVDGDTDVVAGVRAVVTGGHTRDHQAAIVSDGGECFMHLADIVPTRSHIRGPWNQAYDLDALRTMEQKAHYLGLAGGEAMVAVVRARRHRLRRDGEKRSRANRARRTVPVSERLFQCFQ